MKSLATLIRNGDARFARVWSIVSASLLLATASWSQTLTWFGIPPLGYGSVEATGVSANGTVVGYVYDRDYYGDTRYEYYAGYRWAPPFGMKKLGRGQHVANGVSADGSVVVGWFINNSNQRRAFRWVLTNPATGAGTMYDLGTLGGNQSYAYGVSADGSVVVGWSYDAAGYPRAFRWILTDPDVGAGVMIPIDTRTSAYSYAYDVSANGSVVVGEFYINIGNYPYRHAFRWTSRTGMVQITTSEGAAYGVSANGSVVVGVAGNRAFRWVLTDPATGTGTMSDLGTLGGDRNRSEAYDVSADGSVVVGVAGGRAFRWTQETGIQDLNQVYASLLTDGSILTEARAISPNGRYIVGRGYNATTGEVEVFLLDTQGRPSPAGDVNGDGCVDDADLLQVLFNFGGGCN